MQIRKSHLLISVVIGAIAGGILVAMSTNTIPKIVSGIMKKMMERMQECGCNPMEM